MLRIALGLVLLAVAAGVGFFYGRHLHPVNPSGTTAAVTPAPEQPVPAGESRGRTVEMGESGPPVAPAAPIGSPLGEPVVPPPSEEPSSDAIAASGTPPPYRIGLPIAGLTAKDIHDTFEQSRGGGERRHEASDIMAPKGTPVVAVVDGVVKKLFTSVPGGLTVYQYDSAEQYCYYYAHLDRYAEGLREGQLLRRGDRIGYVGVTGNSDPNAPHLHFAVLQLGPEKKWWEDTKSINPYQLLQSALSAARGNRQR